MTSTDSKLDGLTNEELKEKLIAAKKQIKELKGLLKKEKRKNESLRKKLPVGSYTTAGNNDQLESSIWGVLDRHRDRLFAKTQEQEEQPPANTFREKLARFAQPRKTQSVRVCMNGKWVSVKPWMVRKSQEVATNLKPMPMSPPVKQGKLVKAYKSAICVQPGESRDYPVPLPVGGLVHWEWNLEEPGLNIGFELKQGSLLGERTLRWEGMMDHDNLGSYTGTVSGQWAGPGGSGTSDACKVIFGWNNSEGTVSKTITFIIRVYNLSEGSGASGAEQFSIEDEEEVDLVDVSLGGVEADTTDLLTGQ